MSKFYKLAHHILTSGDIYVRAVETSFYFSSLGETSSYFLSFYWLFFTPKLFWVYSGFYELAHGSLATAGCWPLGQSLATRDPELGWFMTSPQCFLLKYFMSCTPLASARLLRHAEDTSVYGQIIIYNQYVSFSAEPVTTQLIILCQWDWFLLWLDFFCPIEKNALNINKTLELVVNITRKAQTKVSRESGWHETHRRHKSRTVWITKSCREQEMYKHSGHLLRHKNHLHLVANRQLSGGTMDTSRLEKTRVNWVTTVWVHRGWQR